MPEDDRIRRQTRLTPLQRVLSSHLVTGLGMFLGRCLPPSAGYGVANLIAGLINTLKPAVYGVVYNNLRQVMGPGIDEHTLHQLTREVFRNTAYGNYELWHLATQTPQVIQTAVHVPPESQAHINQALSHGKGIVVAGVHTGNFDVAMLAFAPLGLDVQILGLAELPTGGFHLMDRMRERAGLRLTSTGVSALREAVTRLRAGGIVVTGVDRPVSGEGSPIEFFGRSAPLPTGHIRLALRTDAVIVVAGAERDALLGTVAHFSAPVEMAYTGDADEDLRINARKVSGLLEAAIRARPSQWGMFVPVWSTPHTARRTARQRSTAIPYEQSPITPAGPNR